MSNGGRPRDKGRSEGGTYLSLPHRVMDTQKFKMLSSYAVKLLCDIGRQFNGRNNGDLCATWKVMSGCGWKSPGTLDRARKELRCSGFIELTRQGGRHLCNLYALTWWAIDDCNGKLDVRATRVPSGRWKDGV